MQFDPEDSSDERPSKSQRKRDMHRLQDLGAGLLEQNAATLARLPLSATLRAALAEAAHIPGRGALKRHLQYIGKLMRGEDAEAIAAALERLNAGGLAEKRLLHEVEQWRERLIEEGDPATADFISAWPGAEAQQLRQLIRSARLEREREKPPAAARKLFRYLRQVMQGG